MMSSKLRPFLQSILLLSGWLPASGVRAELREYDSPHYSIQTDLPEEAVREAALRMTKMAEEYARRTRGFSGPLPPQMPFYLYANDADFFAHGGTADTAGYFDGKALVVRAGQFDDRVWHTVQHEGFHQFAAATIRGSLPTWLNEGLAEYFGEAVFTGDSFVSGLIPQWRLKRIRETLSAKKFTPVAQLLDMPLSDWNQQMTIANYDQAWSMVQFLAHGDGGKYQPALTCFINELSIGQNPGTAWKDALGDVDAFEQRWRAYWLALPDNPTLDGYAQAETVTLTHYLARAVEAKQSFGAFPSFITAASADEIPAAGQDWLPKGLLQSALVRLPEMQKLNCQFELFAAKAPRPPTLRCALPDGRTITAACSFRDGHVAAVTATVLPAKH